MPTLTVVLNVLVWINQTTYVVGYAIVVPGKNNFLEKVVSIYYIKRYVCVMQRAKGKGSVTKMYLNDE